jgi:hypothetical protein
MSAFGTFVKYWMGVTCGFITESSILFHWCTCRFVFHQICSLCYCDSVVWFKVRYCDASHIAVWIALSVWGFLCFHMNVRIVFPVPVKNVVVIYMEFHWTCRFLSEKFPFHCINFTHPRTLGVLPVFTVFINFFYTFHCRHLPLLREITPKYILQLLGMGLFSW